MAEVVENSTSYLTPEDVQAMVTYLRGVPPQSNGYETPAAVALTSTDTRGRLLFVQACTGLPTYWTARVGNPPGLLCVGDHGARESSGTNVVQVPDPRLADRTSQGAMFMHSFIGGYSDDELAAIGNFVIGQFGLRQGTITPEQTRAQTHRLRTDCPVESQ